MADLLRHWLMVLKLRSHWADPLLEERKPTAHWVRVHKRIKKEKNWNFRLVRKVHGLSYFLTWIFTLKAEFDGNNLEVLLCFLWKISLEKIYTFLKSEFSLASKSISLQVMSEIFGFAVGISMLFSRRF